MQHCVLPIDCSRLMSGSSGVCMIVERLPRSCVGFLAGLHRAVAAAGQQDVPSDRHAVAASGAHAQLRTSCCSPGSHKSHRCRQPNLILTAGAPSAEKVARNLSSHRSTAFDQPVLCATQEWASANSVALPVRDQRANTTSYYRFEEEVPTNILQVLRHRTAWRVCQCQTPLSHAQKCIGKSASQIGVYTSKSKSDDLVLLSPGPRRDRVGGGGVWAPAVLGVC